MLLSKNDLNSRNVGGSLSKLVHVGVLLLLLSAKIQFCQIHTSRLGAVSGTRRRERLQDFPCMDLFVAGPPQIDFPS